MSSDTGNPEKLIIRTDKESLSPTGNFPFVLYQDLQIPQNYFPELFLLSVNLLYITHLTQDSSSAGQVGAPEAERSDGENAVLTQSQDGKVEMCDVHLGIPQLCVVIFCIKDWELEIPRKTLPRPQRLV